jgi:hypothetical protein
MADRHQDGETKLTVSGIPDTLTPVDVVIAWVDGDDPKLAEKRSRYLSGARITTASGAHSTRFASSNEIRYCVLSILRFAPFVRNIFIVTDEQDPGIDNDVRKYFPDRTESLRIVDHREIFEGFEKHLPTFNSISIANMIWRIRGLSDNFVYFNDDTFLVRPVKPEDWFVNGRPVMRGKWVPSPLPRELWNHGRTFVQRRLLGNKGFEPRASFHAAQWNAAIKLGFRFRYFTNAHTPHAVSKPGVERFLGSNMTLLEKNISYRFRDYSQFTFISLANHLQLLEGNRNIARPDLVYLKPVNRPEAYIEDKIRHCESHQEIKFMCAQSLDMCPASYQERLFGWLERLLQLEQAVHA